MTIELDKLEATLQEIYEHEIEKMKRLGTDGIATGVVIDLIGTMIHLEWLRWLQRREQLRIQTRWIAKSIENEEVA